MTDEAKLKLILLGTCILMACLVGVSVWERSDSSNIFKPDPFYKLYTGEYIRCKTRYEQNCGLTLMHCGDKNIYRCQTNVVEMQ